MRLFVHPTRACNLSCSGCYLTDVPQNEKEERASLLGYLGIADRFGFNELSLLLNPHNGVKGDFVLLSRAKTLKWTTNVTTTHQVALIMSEENLSNVDILSISVDTERYKTPEQALKWLQKVREHIPAEWPGTLNVNLTYTEQVFEWVKDPSFITSLKEHADMVNHLMMKPVEQYYGSYEHFYSLLKELWELPHMDIMGKKTKNDMVEPCMYHMLGIEPCNAGYDELSLSPEGLLSPCVFAPHYIDATTPQKFREYLVQWSEKPRRKVARCSLVE